MNNYCIDPLQRRCSSALPDSVLSPPLTPALPQQHPFDKRHSTDLGYPYRYSMDYHHWMNHSHMHQQNMMQPQQQTRQTIRKQPTKKNKHVCTYPDCNWSFKRYEHLKRHMLVHTGERPYNCSYSGCGKRFSRSDNFHAHFRTHEKNAFKQKQKNSIKDENLIQPTQEQQYYGNYHLLPTPSPKPVDCIYNPEQEPKKPHACDHPNCDKRFRRLEHLKRHRRIHTNEQPFKCNFPGCLKAFSRSDNLTQHRKTHDRRGSKYEEAPQYMHPEPFSLVDFIRDDSTKLFNWQNPGDTSHHHQSQPQQHHHHHHHNAESVHC
ncbi:hypothetical protein G6F56_000823 [Rhizopus delemar]|nr:hypothetical protein G6F56_000823 [Rhizopus delemar]